MRPLSFNTSMAQRAEAEALIPRMPSRGALEQEERRRRGPGSGMRTRGRGSARDKGAERAGRRYQQHAALPGVPSRSLASYRSAARGCILQRLVKDKQRSLFPHGRAPSQRPVCSETHTRRGFAHCPSPATIGARGPSNTQPRQPGARQEQGAAKGTARDSAELC